MQNSLRVFLVLFFFVSTFSEAQNKKLTYKNIVILSDMSSRLDFRPQKDLKEIFGIVNYFKNECVKPGKKIGDKSSISFSLFSDNIVATIDISKYKNLSQKQRFINSTREFKNCGLNQQIINFNNTVKKVYGSKRNEGLDLISLLIDKIDNKSIIKSDTYYSDGVNNCQIKYENHIYIFTDGYLEYRNKNENSQFYFGNKEIQKVRQYCLDNKIDVVKAIKSNKSLCLPAYKNNLNSHIILHIMETHERDKNFKLQTYKYPLGLRDNEILEAVWRKWAKESGFLKIEWDKY